MSQKRSSVTERVIQTVATATGRDEVDLPPLFDAIDPDALETVVSTISSGEIRFSYAGLDVAVDSDGSVSIAGEQAGDFTRGVAAGES